MKVLHIDCSPRPAAWSRKLTSLMIERLSAVHPDVTIMRRDLGLEPITHHEADYATALSNREAYITALSGSALNISEELIRQLEAADIVVLGTPMNNFTIPSVLKAWLDHIILMGRTIAPSPTGKIGLLRDRPFLIGVASGGVFHGEQSNQPDFLTPYLTAALECLGFKSLRYFRLQATAALDNATLNRHMQSLLPAIDATVGALDIPASGIQ